MSRLVVPGCVAIMLQFKDFVRTFVEDFLEVIYLLQVISCLAIFERSKVFRYVGQSVGVFLQFSRDSFNLVSEGAEYVADNKRSRFPISRSTRVLWPFIDEYDRRVSSRVISDNS